MPNSSPLMNLTMEIAYWWQRQGVTEYTGSNDHPAIKHFLSRVKHNEGDPWCAAFVYHCIETAGFAMERYEPPIKKTAWVWALWQDAMEKGQMILPKDVGHISDVPYGSIFILQYGDRKGHTGFVRSVDPPSGKYRTLEGNRGNTIKLDQRSLKDNKLKGFICYE